MNLIISDRPWVKAEFGRRIKVWGADNWQYLESLDNLPEGIDRIFFPHWSKIVTPEIVNNYECVNFHETALPWGRGGSPIQNCIALGLKDTIITAHRMTSEIDAGPIYCQRHLSLLGPAEEIYIRAQRIIFDMIADIAAHNPTPVEQRPPEKNAIGGTFRRRTPEQSRIEATNLDELFDHIRMLDAEGYPAAFLEYGNFRIEFKRAALRVGRIDADCVITEKKC